MNIKQKECRKRTLRVTTKVLSVLLSNAENPFDLHVLTKLLSGGCCLHVLESFLEELSYKKRKLHSLGESIEKGDQEIDDILDKFGPYFQKMDLAIKLFATQIWFTKPFLSGKKELKLLLNAYLLKKIHPHTIFRRSCVEDCNDGKDKSIGNSSEDVSVFFIFFFIRKSF